MTSPLRVGRRPSDQWPPSRTRARLAGVGPAVLALSATVMLAGCTVLRGTALQDTVPACGDPQRLAIVAQSVPGAAYVPCITAMPEGWTAASFDPARGGTRFVLSSDRAPGRPVLVELTARCAVSGAIPTTPRADGVRTSMRLTSISPRFSGRLYDVFPGGCVSYRFDFDRGPHIALMEQFESAIGLYPRLQLRLDLRKKLGVELDP